MARYRLTVNVDLKPGVLDPQGQAVGGVLKTLGFSVGDVRVGRRVTLEVDAESLDHAKDLARDMASSLLANPVLEDFVVEEDPTWRSS